MCLISLKTYLVLVNLPKTMMFSLNFILFSALLNPRVPMRSFLRDCSIKMAFTNLVAYLSHNQVFSSFPSSKHKSDFPIVHTTVAINFTFATWHIWLGHPNSDVQKLVLNICNISIFNKIVSEFCSCCLGKHIDYPHIIPLLNALHLLNLSTVTYVVLPYHIH